MEKVKLPIRIKIVAVLLIIIGCFLNIILCSMYGYSSSDYLLIMLEYSCLFFGILLLLRIKWAWYGAMASAVVISFGFLSIIYSLVENLFIIFLFVAPSLIFLTRLFFDRKKYMEVASLKISPERKKINILIIVGLSILFGLCFMSIASRSQNMENRMKGKYERAMIQTNFKTIQEPAELFYNSNNNRYSSAVLSSPFSGECPKFGDGNTMFAKDRTVASVIEYVKEVASHVNCHMSADAQSWAIDANYGDNSSWCVDSLNNATSTTINSATGLCSEQKVF